MKNIITSKHNRHKDVTVYIHIEEINLLEDMIYTCIYKVSIGLCFSLTRTK